MHCESQSQTRMLFPFNFALKHTSLEFIWIESCFGTVNSLKNLEYIFLRWRKYGFKIILAQ